MSPTGNELVRWGTDIHDRWMLPHFCETDFRGCDAGFARGRLSRLKWTGSRRISNSASRSSAIWRQRDLQLELRTALEPWHVLGEEPGGGGTVRYVDSSVERLQVRASGLIGDRFAITVQRPSRAAASHRHERRGRGGRALSRLAAAGMPAAHHRRRMRRCAFDLVDTWNQRSLGGCTYHVAHPGGLSHERFPVNTYEAESRRLARFFRHGHSRASLPWPPAAGSADFPFTLDLRNV